jgi:hypothetical protein
MTRWLVLLALALTIANLAAAGLARLRGKLTELLAEPVPGRPARGGALVACATCGVHVPRQRARAAVAGTGTQSFYCSEACRRHGPATAAAAGTRSV